MNRVFVLGGATLDTIITYEQMESLIHQSPHFSQTYLLLEEGQKIEVTAQSTVSGGGATNAAVSFQRQGYEVSLCCKVGNDLAGRLIQTELQSHQVDTQFFKISASEQTATSFVVPSLSGDRTVFAFRGANASLSLEDLPLAQLAQCQFAYISSLSKQAAESFHPIVSEAKRRKVKVVANPGGSQLKLGAGFMKEALKNIDVLILNYEEAQQLLSSLLHSGQVIQPSHRNTAQSEDPHALLDTTVRFQDTVFNLRQFFEAILLEGCQVVVVTHGKRGVYVATPQQFYFHPAAPAQAVNTLGAGDAFGSAFAGFYCGGFSVPEAIRAGLVNSASVIQYPDAKTGLLTQAKILAAMAQLDPQQLKIWS